MNNGSISIEADMGSVINDMRSSTSAFPNTSGKPLVSLVIPAYNEALIIEKNLVRICQYMESLEDHYRWEVILINDGSTDDTGNLAESFAKDKENIHVFHHPNNFGLGQAFQSAFKQCQGDYVITLDLDLSYSADHIERLLNKIRQSKAKIVLASPYMKGGKVSNVPWLRRILSIGANRFLAMSAEGQLSTLTSMVRVYDARFLKSLDLRSMGMGIMPEIIHKTMILGGRIEEIPGHLSWSLLKAEAAERRSSMKILRHIVSTMISAFLFRPVMFFILPGLLVLVFALWVNSWMFAHFFTYYYELSQYSSFLGRSSAAMDIAFDKHTHTFVIGLLSLMLSVQLISLGVLSLQSKNYFEEMFHLCSSIYKKNKEHFEKSESYRES